MNPVVHAGFVLVNSVREVIGLFNEFELSRVEVLFQDELEQVRRQTLALQAI